uniref:Uncharacterized protein n=1 Tax=Sinocyclocheilus grahami TaxID=75366 RepID=A0A672MFQ3_SINGR
MKLWDILATCLLLLSSVSARPVFHKLQPSKRAVVRSETPALDPIIDSQPETTHQKQASMEEQYDVNGFNPEQFESVMDFIQATIGRLRRSSDVDSQTKRDRGRQRGATHTERSGRGRGDRKRGRGRGREDSRDDRVKGQGRGCLLKEIHLNNLKRLFFLPHWQIFLLKPFTIHHLFKLMSFQTCRDSQNERLRCDREIDR